MTPGNLFRCGLTADYANECLLFLREHFDCDDPDPAITCRATAAFASHMRKLFCDGYILSKPAEGTTQKSATQIVLQQVETPEPPLDHSDIVSDNVMTLNLRAPAVST